MSRLIHFIARLYPRSWRERYGAEFIALLEDVRPDGRTVANVLAGALTMHIRIWKSWKILAASAGIGAAIGVGLFVAIPNSYVSTAVLKVGGQALGTDATDAIKTTAVSVESRATLTHVITTFDLYRRERSREPLEDVINRMRTRIIIEPLGANAAAFAIRYNYDDPRIAQQVTQDLASRFLSESQHSQGVNLQVLDPASLPQSSIRNNRLIIGLGIAGFLLMWGGLAGWRSVSARRYAFAGSSISSEFPGGSGTALGLPPFREHLRRNSWKILAAIALLLAVAALSFKLATSSYESTAVIKVLPPRSPQALVSVAQSVEDPLFLTRLITTYSLYPGERSMPFGNLTEQMRRHIRIEPVPLGSKNVAGIRIRFSYPDPFLAQKVTQELVSQLLVSQLIDASPAGNSATSLSVLDYASLPQPGPLSVVPRFTVGLFVGLLLGVILAMIVSLFRRPPAPV